MNKFLAIILVLIISISQHIVSAQEEMAIEILYENGIVKGDGENLAPNRNMTIGEFATIASRIYSEDYESIEKSLGDWKKATMFCAGLFCAEKEIYENLETNFDKPISPEFAQDILLEMLEPDFKTGSSIGYICWIGKENQSVLIFNGLGDLGYDMTVIPNSEYLTREEGCKMLCELLYLEYPVIGDYRPSVFIEQYTPHGREIVFEIYGDDISFETFGNRPSTANKNQWHFPNDIRSKIFLDENITAGMSREAVENLIGSPYKSEGGIDWYYYYIPQTEEGCRGYMKISYDNNIVSEVWFETTEDNSLTLEKTS